MGFHTPRFASFALFSPLRSSASQHFSKNKMLKC